MNKGFYLKLALSNLRRSRKFYAPYLLASVVTVSMCYIILALNAGHMLDGMRGEMIMRSYMALGGVVVLIFAAIFLFYTNSFLTRRRRQEFGLYSILGMEKRHIARLLSVETLMLFAASLGLGLGLGALLSVFLARSQIRPIREIDSAVRDFSKGDLTRRVELHCGGELEELGNSINRMAGELSELEDSRRNFVAAVSHELRSPITSIAGYLQGMLDGTIPLKAHAHQANDIFTALRIAHEFGLRLTLEHVTEGHLIVDELAKEANVPMAVGPSLTFASKFELQNKSWATPGVLAKAGCHVSIITDNSVIPQQYLPLCAGMAVKAGMDPFDALRAITLNAAEHIGVADRVGSLEVGKDADVVITDGSPFEVMTEVRDVFIDGEMIRA